MVEKLFVITSSTVTETATHTKINTGEFDVANASNRTVIIHNAFTGASAGTGTSAGIGVVFKFGIMVNNDSI